MKRYFFFAVISMLFISTTEAQIVDLELVATGFSRPLDIAHAGDERLFVVERRGKIKIIETEGEVKETPFIDLDPIVLRGNNQDERGLLGMAFHPDYENNGYFFVNYIGNDGNTYIARYTVDSSDPDLGDPESGEIIMMIEQPVWNHNGGCLKFGPDGYLYIGMGDGGAGNDPFDSGQTRTSLLGKMLRIDVDNGLPYTIPEDNPFAEDDFTLDEIWALGLRNPWRYSFDRETGDLWIGDVGQAKIEEIDFQPASSTGGENYGWRCYEGNDFTGNTPMDQCEGDVTFPVFETFHNQGACSITGGFVYRGSLYSELYGKYICADYCTGEFYVVENDGQGGFTGGAVGKYPYAISTFGEDANGELYIAAFGNGSIYHIVGENIVSSLDINAIDEVNVYPNPSAGQTRLTIKTNQSILLTVELIDMQGRIIRSKEVEVYGAYEENFQMEEAKSGTYILNITSGKKLLSKKLVKY